MRFYIPRQCNQIFEEYTRQCPEVVLYLAGAPGSSEIMPAAAGPGAKPLPRNGRVEALLERVAMLEKEVQDSENTHKLRCETLSAHDS